MEWDSETLPHKVKENVLETEQQQKSLGIFFWALDICDMKSEMVRKIKYRISLMVFGVLSGY